MCTAERRHPQGIIGECILSAKLGMPSNRLATRGSTQAQYLHDQGAPSHTFNCAAQKTLSSCYVPRHIDPAWLKRNFSCSDEANQTPLIVLAWARRPACNAEEREAANLNPLNIKKL
jgi:hypothetical protein